MVERINPENAKILARDEFQRAQEEITANLKDSSEAIEMAERFLESIRKVVKFG